MPLNDAVYRESFHKFKSHSMSNENVIRVTIGGQGHSRFNQTCQVESLPVKTNTDCQIECPAVCLLAIASLLPPGDATKAWDLIENYPEFEALLDIYPVIFAIQPV
jgi:hypothetical protein